MRHHLRQSILFLMRHSGLIGLFRFLHRHQIVILMLHGVMDERANSSWRPLRPFLPPRELDRYLRVLSRWYHFVPLSDAVEMLQGRRAMQPYSMVLTFDDGYRNNLTYALPILRRYRAPAAFFVPTGFLDDPRPFWFDRLDYAVQHVPVDRREWRVGSSAACLDGTSREALRASYIQFIRAAQKQRMTDPEFLREVGRLTAQLEAEAGCSLCDIHDHDPWTAIMTWEGIKEAGPEGVTLGSHTVDHVRLGLVDAETARRQLATSRHAIEQHTGQPCQCICYPNGSFVDETIAIARDCGYTSGLTIEEGLNCIGSDTMKLKRIAVRIGLSSNDLLADSSGLSLALSRLHKRYLSRLIAAPAEAWRLMRSHGIRKAVVRMATELYSNKDYVILRHGLDSPMPVHSDPMPYRIERLQEGDGKGIEEVCHAWPANWRSKHLKAKVRDDLRKGDVCFLLRSESQGKVLGGIWLCTSDGIMDHCPLTHYSNEGTIRSLFIVPEARGRRLSELLLRHVITVARERGMCQIFGYALPHRTASIRAQRRVGFTVAGTLRLRARWGHTRYQFIPNSETQDQHVDSARTDSAVRLWGANAVRR